MPPPPPGLFAAAVSQPRVSRMLAAIMTVRDAQDRTRRLAELISVFINRNRCVWVNGFLAIKLSNCLSTQTCEKSGAKGTSDFRFAIFEFGFAGTEAAQPSQIANRKSKMIYEFSLIRWDNHALACAQ